MNYIKAIISVEMIFSRVMLRAPRGEIIIMGDIREKVIFLLSLLWAKTKKY
jgi:hypothetical protein